MRARGPRARLLLLGSVFVVAACGLVYELAAGALASYLIGDAVTQYSLVIGVFMCAMGVGSWLARFVRGDALRALVGAELGLAVVGGLSSLVIYAAGAFADPWFEAIFFPLCAAVGTLIGLEIPILVRLLREGGSLRAAVSDALALDYVGALLGAIAFPLVALPLLGVSKASLVAGLLNAAVATGLLWMAGRPRGLALATGAVWVILLGALAGSGRLVGFMEDQLYQDTVVYAEQTPYQRVVLTRWRQDLRLYLDGHVQFSSVDEARYHEALVLPGLAAAAPVRDVLVLGGGDGLATARVLREEGVQRVDLVDLDPAITRLARSYPPLVALNGGSLSDPRVQVHHEDALAFLEASEEGWDLILIDLPDPHNRLLAKLYSRQFYALALRRLRPRGALITQATSPFYAPQAYWSIVATLEAALPPEHPEAPLRVLPYHSHVPSFGEWGFVLATRAEVDPRRLVPSIPTEVHDAASLQAMFVWDKALGGRPEVRINTLDAPVTARYYRRGWRNFNQ